MNMIIWQVVFLAFQLNIVSENILYSIDVKHGKSLVKTDIVNRMKIKMFEFKKN